MKALSWNQIFDLFRTNTIKKKKIGKGGESLRRWRRRQNADEIPNPALHKIITTQKQKPGDGKRIEKELLDKDDFSAQLMAGPDKETLPTQMERVGVKKRSVQLQEFVSTGTIEEDFSLEEQFERSFPRNSLRGDEKENWGEIKVRGGEKEGWGEIQKRKGEKERWGEIEVINLDRSEDILTEVEKMSMDLIKLRFSEHESRRKGKELFRELGYITMAASRLNR